MFFFIFVYVMFMNNNHHTYLLILNRLWFVVGPVVRRWFLEAPRLLGGWEGAELATICASYYPTLNKSLWAHNQDAIQVRTLLILIIINNY